MDLFRGVEDETIKGGLLPRSHPGHSPLKVSHCQWVLCIKARNFHRISSLPWSKLNRLCLNDPGRRSSLLKLGKDRRQHSSLLQVNIEQQPVVDCCCLQFYKHRLLTHTWRWNIYFLQDLWNLEKHPQVGPLFFSPLQHKCGQAWKNGVLNKQWLLDSESCQLSTWTIVWDFCLNFHWDFRVQFSSQIFVWYFCLRF